MAVLFECIDTWMRFNLPALRSALGARGRRKVRRWFVRRKDFSELRIKFDVDPYMTFVAPRPWQLATGYLPTSGEVCRVGFGVSPLDDEIYVDDLEVHPSLRRRGLAGMLLNVVVERCSPPGVRLPIAPVQEYADSVRFWEALRDGAVPGVAVRPQVRRCEMDMAARYWAELARCSDDFLRYIREQEEKCEDPRTWNFNGGFDACGRRLIFLKRLERLMTRRAPDR